MIRRHSRSIPEHFGDTLFYNAMNDWSLETEGPIFNIYINTRFNTPFVVLFDFDYFLLLAICDLCDVHVRSNKNGVCMI